MSNKHRHRLLLTCSNCRVLNDFRWLGCRSRFIKPLLVPQFATGSLLLVFDHKKKGKGREICIAPHCEKLTSEALRYGSHNCYTANTPYLPLPRKRSPDGVTTV